MQVEILIRAKRDDTAGWQRYWGLSIDEPLDRSFWDTEPDKIIKITGTSMWHEFIHVDLPEGRHYLVLGNSHFTSDTDKWFHSIAVNGSLLAEDVEINVGTPLQVDFDVSGEPPSPKRNWWWLLLLLATVIVGGVIHSQSGREEEGWRKERW